MRKERTAIPVGTTLASLTVPTSQRASENKELNVFIKIFIKSLLPINMKTR